MVIFNILQWKVTYSHAIGLQELLNNNTKYISMKFRKRLILTILLHCVELFQLIAMSVLI